MIVVYLFQTSIIFVKKENLSQIFIGRRLLVLFNFNSFIPETYKTGLVKSFLLRCFSLCSDFVKFLHEINIKKRILHNNSYPRDFADKCI